MDYWEDFFNQSAVDMFGSKVNKGRICTNDEGKIIYKREKSFLSSVYELRYINHSYLFCNKRKSNFSVATAFL